MQFSSEIMTATDDLNTFDPKGYFENYDFWEEYDVSKQYSKEEFSQGGKNYINVLYQIHSRKNNDVKKYVVAEEQYDEEELRALAKYCPCYVCQMWFFNPVKYLSCRCCCGCIKSMYRASARNVKVARLQKQLDDLKE